MPRRFRLILLCALAALTACGSEDKDAPITVSVIGTRAELTDPIQRLPSPAAKAMLEATAQGLVAFDASGDIVPALAQRWIVEDDGLSYIFRLRPALWPDGTRVQADAVAALLAHRIKSYSRPDLKGGLDAVRQVVAMTGEVIEVRLEVPRPNFLQILAQPQMAVIRGIGGTGPYRADWRGGAMQLVPAEDPLAQGDEVAKESAAVQLRDRRILRAERAAMAIQRFRNGRAALMLGGRYQDLPMLGLSRLDQDVVRIDPAPGLFGLAVVGEDPFLADNSVREALGMAIERERIPAMFAFSRWTTTTAIVPGQFDLGGRALQPAWAAQGMAERRTRAAAVIAAWRAKGESVPSLRVALPRGSGSRLLFALIAADLRTIGVSTRLVALDAPADLRLIDEVAPYDSALWYLSRLQCGEGKLCSDAARDALTAAVAATTPVERQQHMIEAEQTALDNAYYIPLAQPLRWSLVAPRLDGFQPNPRARHPLNHLVRSPN